jgi:hypothetical protein
LIQQDAENCQRKILAAQSARGGSGAVNSVALTPLGRVSPVDQQSAIPESCVECERSILGEKIRQQVSFLLNPESRILNPV